MSQKIADFFAQIGIKVDQKALKSFDKSLSGLERDLHNMEVAAKKAGKQIEQNLNPLNRMTQSVRSGNKEVVKQIDLTKRLAREQIRGRAAALAANRRLQIGSGKFRGDLSYMDSAKGLSDKARKAQQSMYDKMFGAVSSPYAGLDKLHGVAIREDQRRLKSAQNIARIQENVARKEQLMAERTAAIREAGAARAAALIRKAEIMAQASANRITGGSVGGRRGSIMGRATVGGALGAATSNIAGFLPGFGAAYSLMSVNRINQQMQGQTMALSAVMNSPELGAEQQAWVKNLSNTVGLNYRNLTPNYTKMLASGQGAGMKTSQVQNIFKGVSEYGRVMGLDTEAMQGSFRAIEQMMNKGQVMSEELKGQLMLAA